MNHVVIKGLIGIGYPPKENYGRDHPDWDPNNPAEESIPDTKKPQQTVHFDLDPKNSKRVMNYFVNSNANFVYSPSELRATWPYAALQGNVTTCHKLITS